MNYKIVGVDRKGKRFRINLSNVSKGYFLHYNVWKGSAWELTNGKYKKVFTWNN